MIESVAQDRAVLIARERLNIFFSTTYVFPRFRLLQLLSVGGAAYAGLLVRLLCDVSIDCVLVWVAAVFIAECLVTEINAAYRRANPDVTARRHWAWAKTALCGMVGISWSLGPILLHVPESPASIIVATCALIYFVTVATGMVGADYAPSMYVVTLGAICPAAIWLASFGHGLELTLGLCLLALLPVMAGSGLIALRKSRVEINNRLEIAELLKTRDHQAQQIERLFAERTRFFSAASHDLRQPLNAMGLYFELLSRAADPAEQADIIMKLRECASSLLRQFDAIMGVSATDMQIRDSQVRPVRIQDLFDRIAATLDPEARRKGLRLRVCPSRAVCAVDPALLERALLNLVGNSIKYTRTGGILLGARRRRDEVQVLICDTGIGIDAKHQKAIFDDFFQVDNPERNREKGLGIGLGIVRRLCDAMHWRIALRSVPGHGTTFLLGLPSLPQNACEVEHQKRPEVPSASTSSERPGIVVIDDDALIRDSLQRLLSGWGYDCIAFASGGDAFDFLARHQTAKRCVVLVDYRLAGGENGLGVADQIILQHGAVIRIGLMTGDIGPEIAEGARQRGLSVLRKPIQPIRLSAFLNSEAA
ncbi:Sensor protein [Bradyrhizobium sp. ORS 375]|uniref:ATP-binding response regulator n=1 Tax=Bradyrhizobium sp. (strain ORS 375) TaxID=566679 RepID=UPI00024059FA|nr:hybrid sensor histidine kinase/response regulator [Bradyrhizobium sp. ORS 375]CCD97044.1 Sensor protein [Bradyrhizobium sp. ORS 375]